jgi:predicted PurR-regulated permease PerM
MAKRNEIYDDFLKMIEERERLSQKYRSRRSIAQLITQLVIFIALVTLLIILKTPLLKNSDIKKQSLSLSELQEKIKNDEKRILNLEKSFTENKNNSYVYLNSKITSIEQKNQYLYDTILKDPDAAITPVLLRKEQENINRKIDDLRGRVDTTNNWLAGILGTLIVSLLIFMIKQIWESFFSKKNIME